MAEVSYRRVKIRGFAQPFEPPAHEESARMDPYRNVTGRPRRLDLRRLGRPALSRRVVLGGLAGALSFPRVLTAQSAGKLPRVGYVGADVPFAVPLREAFLAGLREFGWVDGQNIALDWLGKP